MAAAAVVAVAVAATMAGTTEGTRHRAASGHGAWTALRAPAPAPPRYLIAPAGPGMSVYDSSTGLRASWIAPPAGGWRFVSAAAIAAGRFIVAADRPHVCSTRLFRLTLNARGGLARLTRVPGVRIDGKLMDPYSALAASSGGQVIGYAAEHCNGGPGWVGVIRPAAGQARRWPLASEGLFSLNMSPDGRKLYFDNSPVILGDGTIRVLPTDAPPGPMTSRARIVLPASSGVSRDGSGSIALVADSKVLVACLQTKLAATLIAYSSVTGGRLGVLHTWPHPYESPCVVTAPSTGGDLLVYGIGPGVWRMRLSNGQVRHVGRVSSLVYPSTRPPAGRPVQAVPFGAVIDQPYAVAW